MFRVNTVIYFLTAINSRFSKIIRLNGIHKKYSLGKAQGIFLKLFSRGIFIDIIYLQSPE